MERFWSFFIHKRQFSYLLVIAALLFGSLAIVTIPKESSPEVRIPVGIVTTLFPGASAVDVERLVTNPLEDRLVGSLENQKKVTSTSREGVSSIVVEFTANADLDKSIRSLRDEVDNAKTELPDDAKDSVVTEVNFADQPVITIAVGGNIGEAELQRIALKVKDELLSVSGVSKVSIAGERKREVRVIARKESLDRFGVSLGEIVSSIKASNTALPAGSIEIDGIEYTVQFQGDIDNPKDVGGIAIANRGGAPVYVRDVADVFVDLSPQTSLSRVSIEGKPSRSAISFAVFKQTGGNIAVVTSNVRERISKLSTNGGILANLEVLVVFDSGELLIKDLKNLTRTGLQTIALVMTVLLFAIGWREAILAGIAIPFSFLIGFIALEASGNTINFISLFSLILAIGILIDSAIVIIEGIHTNMRQWMDKVEAAQKTIREFHWPVTAGTLTTIAVFAPLFLISGVTGKFIASIPFTIIFVLLASLFVAIGIIPLFASFFLRRRMTSRFEEIQEKNTEKLKNWYKNKLSLILGNRKRENWFFALLIGLFFVSLSLPMVGLIPIEFFPQEDIDFIFVEIEEPQATILGTTDLEARKAEEILYGNTSIASFLTGVGQSSPFTGNSISTGSRFANIFINLKKNRGKSSSEVVDELRKEFSSIETSKVTVSEPNNGPPTGAPIVVKVLGGSNLDELDKVAIEIERKLAEIPGTANVRTSAQDSGIEFTLELDRGKAAALGLSPFVIASTLRTAIHGFEATTIKRNGKDIAVVVTQNLNPSYTDPHDTNRVNIDAIKQIGIQTKNGTILLGSVLSEKVSPGRSAISHENRERIVTVSSDLGSKGNVAVITRELNKKLDLIKFPEGVTASIGGENEDATQAFKDMFFALILGIILMLAILVLQFDSYRYGIYVLSILPFSLIGIFAGLLITGKAVSFTSLMGFIALAGIVVNNSIILIDVINRLRRENPDRDVYDIVVEGSTSRLRPILLTAITTVVGLIPLAFVSELWSPLAIAIMFGLTFSVVITLLMVPIMYNRAPGKFKN